MFTTAKTLEGKTKSREVYCSCSLTRRRLWCAKKCEGLRNKRCEQCQRVKPRLLFSFESQVTLIYSPPAWHHCREPSPDLVKKTLERRWGLRWSTVGVWDLYFQIQLDYVTSNLPPDLLRHPSPPATSPPGPSPSSGLMSFHDFHGDG